MEDKPVAIIPARGGSKRIPRKNIKLFSGKPIIAYSIEAAIDSGLFGEIMVSTDDDEIAEVALRYGARIPFMRSAATAGDYASTTDVLNEVIEMYGNQNYFFEYVCCIYPCAPFLKSNLLISAYEKLKTEQRDSVFPVVQYSTPIQRAFKQENGKISLFFPQYLNARSQDLEKAYYDSGQFYFFSVKSLREKKTILTENSAGIVIDDMLAQDIDNENDWQMAELKYKFFQH